VWPKWLKKSDEDKRFCEQFVSALEVELADEDIEKNFRLEHRNISTTSDTPVASASSVARPMLVEFSSR